MAPLVPDIISEDFNFIIALLIGIAFGFILEQAGFSSTKKLVGLFYGYDFTVLKVFFTAGVTAMIGIMVLGHLGWLDLQLIYINPTFLWSAIVGGLIMGAGFIIGGFCPGTSVCAAAIGKLDAMAFIFGSLLGILVFTEAYPLLEGIYKAEAWGPVRINEFLGLSPQLFAFLMSMMAFAAFFVTTRIENKINGRITQYSKSLIIKNSILPSLAIIVIVITSLSPNREELILKRISEAERQKKCKFREITADKLASEIVNSHYNINVIDVRDSASFNKWHIPMAINIPLNDLLNSEFRSYFTQTHKRNIFYADNDTVAKKACLKAKYMGKSDNYILKESTLTFYNMFFNLSKPSALSVKEDKDTYRFREKAAREMNNMVKSLKNVNTPVLKSAKKAKGGCS